MRKLLLVIFLAGLVRLAAQAQSALVPMNADYFHLVERYEIKRGKFSEGMHLSSRPLPRKGVANLADSVLAAGLGLSAADKFNLEYLLNDNAEWAADPEQGKAKRAFLKTFYQYKADLFRVKTKDFDLHVNPVLHLAVGNTNEDGLNRPFINTRGAELRGTIARRVGFYTYLADTPLMPVGYVNRFIDQYDAMPYENFWKTREATGNSLANGVTFLTARGYVVFDIIKDKMSLQFGNDKNFFGNGYRSLNLSDFAGNYTFLKLNTRIWKLNYTNIFSQMNAQTVGTNRVYPKKHGVFHHLSMNVLPNLNIGLFEGVMFGRTDNAFEFGYLNPIIFYRSVEQSVGSGDNSMIGADLRWNLFKTLQLYGQIVIDELVVGEVRSGQGWWGNKQGLQAGFKYIDVLGIKNLDLQAEYNLVRPYTYTHFGSNFALSNFTHYNQPLAHPLGANFSELLVVGRFQATPRLQLTAKAFLIRTGQDRPGENWGSFLLADNGTRQQEYGNTVGQGVRTDINLFDLTASYQVRHNAFLEVKQVVRRYRTAEPSLFDNQTLTFTSLALRLNIPQRLWEF
ncbi:MAG: capsule assembly Wzi family protein [Bernardetiaceae bacterium]|jgi:hypothetical protein|nr:capsule assembly Wzi family protein [Bernardetiaceae bacterium]